MSGLYKKVAGVYVDGNESKNSNHSRDVNGIKTLFKYDLNGIYEKLTNACYIDDKWLDKLKEKVVAFYKDTANAERINNGFLLPLADFDVIDIFSKSKASIEPLDLVTFLLDSNSLVISTPMQLSVNFLHVENLMDLMLLDGEVPGFSFKTISYGFDNASYWYDVDEDKVFPYPSLETKKVVEMVKDKGKFRDFSRSLPYFAIDMMPSVFYYEFCKHFNLFKDDVDEIKFYNKVKPGIVSGYF